MSIEPQDRDNYHRPDEPLDDDLQREIDEALGGMSLEEILQAEQPPPAAPGAAAGVRTGRVIAIQGDDIFVDFGGKSQGILPAAQFADEPLPAEGDPVEVTIEGYDPAEGLLLLSRQGAVLAATWETIEPGQVVEAFVTGSNKGGLELKFHNIDAFMPISMIEMGRVEDLSPYIHQKLACEIIEIDRRRDSVTVSRRAVLEKEAAEARERTLATLAEGQVVEGVVRSIMPYGAFVNLGGVDGLLHISDLSHHRVEDPHEIVTEGQHVKVMVLKIDRDADRISLGLKQAMPDPWEAAELKWPVNEIVSGRVTKLMDFGAFVELAEGVEGLIPISEMSFEKRIHHPRELLKEGDVTKVRVLRVDPQQKRISLSLKRVGDDPWLGASVRWPVDSVVEGVVSRIETFGAFVELIPGVEGLLHISELAEGRVRTVSDAVKPGQLIQAKVLSVDEEKRRISLSIKKLLSDPNYTGPAGAAEDAPPAQAPPKRKRPLKGGLD